MPMIRYASIIPHSNSLSISLDVNECLKSPCKKSEVCVNKIKTGYECVCPKNFIRDKASKKCIRK